jgi:hypothetical protein
LQPADQAQAQARPSARTAQLPQTPGASALTALAQFSDAQQAMLKGFTPEVQYGGMRQALLAKARH